MAQQMAAEWDLPEANLSFEGDNEAFVYNRHNESIYDDVRYFPGLKHDQETVVKFDASNDDFINHATLRALIVQLTSPEVIDYNLICDFFLTYRTFTDSHTVMNLLLTRLIWSLQYVNSFKQDTEKIGKLVLLRTFVVLRHWILNYFIDDFLPDDKLCDTFSFYINQITHESHLIRANMVFELKIMTDLKIHWTSQINEFLKAGLPLDAAQNVFTFLLPPVSELATFKKLSKSNTEASIHTNPSFRRSAMLSLYDQKTHHKCLIYDDSNANDENPQLSINNLLSQHKSSRTSLNDKLTDFKGKNLKKLERRATTSKKVGKANKHKYINLTDSSLALKKTSNVTDDMETKPYEVEKENIAPVGFSTNGQVKLPTSRVSAIVPLTPAKKMEYKLIKDLPPTPKSPDFNIGLDDSEEVGRKKSLKKIVNEWKRSFNSPDLKNEKSDTFAPLKSPADSPLLVEENPLGDRIDVLSARIIDELEYLIRYYITDLSTINEADDRDYISRSAIEYSQMEQNDPKADSPSYEDNEGENWTKVADDTLSPLVSKDQMSIQDVSELNIDKIDNLFSQDNILLEENYHEMPHEVSKLSNGVTGEANNSKRSSFGGRVASINWNDEGNLNLDVSELLDEEASHSLDSDLKGSHFNSDRMIKTSTQYFDVSSEIPVDTERPRTPSSVSTPSDLENYNEEVCDLGIAMSPQSMQKVLLKSTLNDQFNTMNKRMSVRSRNSSGSQFKRDSVKSYISYDSAFSISSNSKSANADGNLRKKHGYNNLRKLAYKPSDYPEDLEEDPTSERVTGMPVKLKSSSMLSHISRSSSLRRSVRFSTLCALTELPFNYFGESSESVMRLNTETTGRLRKLSDIADSSVFSCAIIGRKSTIYSTRKSSDQSSTMSVAIPGISNYDLKELAAIPDESYLLQNPVQSALYKLEGKKKSDQNSTRASTDKEPTSKDLLIEEPEPDVTTSHVSTKPQSSNDLKLEKSPTNNTEDILAEINNAVTEDAIDYSSEVEKELREKPVTPIKPMSKAYGLSSASTSNMNALLTSVPNSENTSPFSILNPKVVLDGYSLTSSNLSIENVVTNGKHVSFVLSYASKSLAEHLTIIEKDMLQEIDWKELIELQWNKELTPVNSWLEIIVNESYYNKNKGVNLVIARFNLMVNWVISEILLTKSESEQIAIISRYIHVAYHCLAMQNFSTLMQIVLALTSEKVAKLKNTWKNLPPGDILTLKNLEALTSPTKNFIKIRLCMNQLQPSRGCIPFVGLYLSDLIFNAERPKFVKTNKTTFEAPQLNDPLPGPQRSPSVGGTPKMLAACPTPIPSTPPKIRDTSVTSTPTITGPNAPAAFNDSCEQSVTIGDLTINSDTSGGEREKMINFSRFRTSVHIVKSLSQCIEWSKKYEFDMNDELLRKCLYIKSLDEEEMNYCLGSMES